VDGFGQKKNNRSSFWPISTRENRKYILFEKKTTIPTDIAKPSTLWWIAFLQTSTGSILERIRRIKSQAKTIDEPAHRVEMIYTTPQRRGVIRRKLIARLVLPYSCHHAFYMILLRKLNLETSV